MDVRRTFLLLAALVVAVPLLRGAAQEPQRLGKRDELMRQKLELSKRMLEELTRGDLDTVAGDAHKLHVIGELAEWGNPPPRDEKQYAYFLRNFQRNCDDLGKMAKAKDLEGSTFAYVHITLNCIECHKLVRDQPEKK